MPDEPEANALLALMLIHHARRAARFAGDQLMLLEDQDRSLWDAGEIAAGRRALDRAIALRGRGPYVFQAAIASLQLERPIDWPQVAALYEELAKLTRSPVVELNRAVAIAESESLEDALDIVERLPLSDYQYLHSTRAELLRRLGRHEEARAAYQRALELAHSQHERRFLERRIAEL
jgi:RNA polymerase sigma-70 factor, ECF subfamily